MAVRDGAQLAVTVGRPREAAAGFRKAVELLPLASWHGLGRASQERFVADSLGLAAGAAASALQIAEVQESVRLLELRRSVMWGISCSGAPNSRGSP
jgi:hypothetical protein